MCVSHSHTCDNNPPTELYASAEGSAQSAFGKLRLFYSACMNTSGPSRERTRELLGYIKVGGA